MIKNWENNEVCKNCKNWGTILAGGYAYCECKNRKTQMWQFCKEFKNK